MTKKGILYLIPIPIAEGKLDTILPSTVTIIHNLNYFVAENARTARRFISSTRPPYALQDVDVKELNKHDAADINTLLAPLSSGHNVGVMSEAGCPGVADPGALLVEWAHKKEIKVIPLVGPSSILLALMASGLNGQNFKFNGYLSSKREQLKQELKRLESESRKQNCTQIFIEAPYRNRQVTETAFDCLQKSTKFSISSNLNADDEYISTRTIGDWRSCTLPELHKKATIFLLMAN